MSKVVVERKGRFALLQESRFFRVCGVLSIAFILFSITLIFWRLFPQLYGQQVVPLHYNIHYGVDLTGTWWQIFTLPVSGFVLLGVNAFLAFLLIKREVMLAKIIGAATVVLSLFIFIATVFVVLLNLVYA